MSGLYPRNGREQQNDEQEDNESQSKKTEHASTTGIDHFAARRVKNSHEKSPLGILGRTELDM
jgi:hypothetical protein